MPNIPEIDRMFQKAQQEVGDKIFGLLWCFTFIQAALILWELLSLFPLTIFLLGSYANPAIHATEMTTAVYFILQLAYMGKKEFLRWTKGLPGTTNFTTAGNLSSEETSRRLIRGDVAVIFWGVLIALGVCMNALTLIPRVPQELLRTFIQVIGLYAFATASKSIQQAHDKHPASINTTSVSTTPEQHIEDELDRSIITYLEQNGTVGIQDILEGTDVPLSTLKLHLKNLVEAGFIVREGTARSTVYKIKSK